MDVLEKFVKNCPDTITRELAKELDEAMDGKLSESIHVNSFTEVPSETNLKETYEIVSNYVNNKVIIFSVDDVKDTLNILRKNEKALSKLSEVQVSAVKYDKLASLKIKIDECDTDTYIKEISVTQFINNIDEICEVIGVEVLPVFKAKAIIDLNMEYAYRLPVYKCFLRRDMDVYTQNIGEVIKKLESLSMSDPVIKLYVNSWLAREIKHMTSQLTIEIAGYINGLLEN